MTRNQGGATEAGAATPEPLLRDVNTRGIRTRVLEAGDPAAPAIVLIHGMFESHLTFEEVNNILPVDIVSSEEIDEILGILGDENIKLIDSEEDLAKGAAEEEKADLIIMGRQGLSHEVGGGVDRLRRAMAGGVADKVSRHANVPVMVVT